MLDTVFFFLMIRRPPRSTLDRSSAASDVYKRQLIYLAAVDGIKFEEAEVALAKRVADVKQRADAVRERSMQATARSVTSSPNPQFAAERDGATSIPSGCPKCGNAVTVDDIFCGSCGQKL